MGLKVVQFWDVETGFTPLSSSRTFFIASSQAPSAAVPGLLRLSRRLAHSFLTFSSFERQRSS
jgi:hypothetical protein